MPHFNDIEYVVNFKKHNGQPYLTDGLDPSTLYILIEDEHWEWLEFLCPCGNCINPVKLYIGPEKMYPKWIATLCCGQLTVTPSIHRNALNNNCHFFVEASDVRWV